MINHLVGQTVRRLGAFGLLVPMLLAGQSPGAASPTIPASQRLASARALMRVMKLDSAALLLRQVLDSGAVASPAERVEAWVLTGVSQFYLGADSGAVHAFREAFALDPSAQAQLPDPDLQRMFDGLRPVPSAAPMATGPARLPEDMIYNCLPKCPEGVQPPKLVLGSEGLGMLRVKVRAGEMPRTPTLVAIRAVVDSMGFVEPGSIELPPSGLPADFTEPFIEELRHRRYTPARLGDRPVRARIEVRIKVRGLP